jgi:HEAT repeat protein
MMNLIQKAVLAVILALSLGAISSSAAERVDETLIDELTGVAANPERKPSELEPLYLQLFESLTRRLSSKVELDRTESQAQLQMMIDHVGRPGQEAQAKVYFSAVSKQLEKQEFPAAARHLLIRGLGQVGTADCIPTLVKLMGAGDPIEADLARMSLQHIPGEAADSALVEAIKGSAGDTKMTLGLIDSLAARGNEGAVATISPLLGSTEPAIASAAATALGWIGGAAATKALGAARSQTADEGAQMVIELALLDIATERGSSGDRDGAAKIFQILGQQTKSSAVRRASMFGLAKSQPQAADAIVIEAVKSEDPRTRSAGISASTLVPNRRLSAGLAAMLMTAPKQVQLQILNALTVKGDISVQDQVLEFLKQVEDKDKELEAATIRSLGSIGSVSVVELLLQKSISKVPSISDAAQAALGELEGQEIAQTIDFHARQGKTPEIRATAIGLFMRNRDRSGLTRVMDFAAEPDRHVSAAAMSVLRQQAGEAEFRKLLDLMIGGQLQVLPVLTAICGRTTNPDLVTGEIITYLRTTDNLRYQSFLISCLPLLGSSRGLAVVVENIAEGKKTMDPAVKALGKWPDPTALPEMLKILKSRSDDSATAGVMVKGITHLVSESKDSMSLDNRVRYVVEAFEVSPKARERMLLLSVMSHLPHEKIAEIVEEMLKDRYVATAAANTAATLCEQLVETNPSAAQALATTLANGQFNSIVRGRGRAVLTQLGGSEKGL